MTTPGIDRQRELAATKLDAEISEAEARLKVMQAQAEQRKARQEMDEISGLAAAKERVKKSVAEMKQQAAADYAATKSNVERELKDLQVGIQRVNERYTTWDAARERRFYARLDEAEARLKVWKAKGDQKRVEATVKGHDDLATLEERIALARARAAAAKSEKHSAAAQTALQDAAQHFDEAYDAASKRYARV